MKLAGKVALGDTSLMVCHMLQHPFWNDYLSRLALDAESSRDKTLAQKFSVAFKRRFVKIRDCRIYQRDKQSS